MEVLLGPTYGMDVSAPSTAYVRDRSGLPAQDNVVASPCLFLNEDSGVGNRLTLDKFGSGHGSNDSSDSSSSIGAADDSEEEDENDDVSSEKTDEQSQNKFSLDSLEDSLPVKRGLSNHFMGKSKSYANLADVCSVKDLVKPENPLNKRRRVLMASKLARESSFYSWQNPKSMPLLTLNEEEEDGDGLGNQADNFSSNFNGKEKEDGGREDQTQRKLGQSRLTKMGLSQSCFSLADLQEEHE